MAEQIASPGREKDGHFSVRARIQELWQRREADEAKKRAEGGAGASPASGAADDSPEALNWAFEKLPVSLFPPVASGEIIEVASDSSVADAIRLLSAHGILSAPVRNVDAPADASWIDRYLGLLDFAGIVLWVLGKASQLRKAGDGGGEHSLAPSSSVSGDYFSLLLKSEVFQQTKVCDVAGSFRWAPFLPVTPDDSLLTLLLLVSKYRLRSVPVVDSGRPAVLNLVTQSGVVAVLADCRGLPWFDALAERPIKELGLPCGDASKVIAVEDDAPVLEPFRRMLSAGVGGVPVLAKGTRQVVGSVSVRDIQLLLVEPQLFTDKTRPLNVSEFLEIAKGRNGPVGLLSPAASPPIRCRNTITLQRLMEQLQAARVHRVYVTDEVGELEGVVTLRDIIGKFVVEPPDYFGDFFGGVVPDVHPTASEPMWLHGDWDIGGGW